MVNLEKIGDVTEINQLISIGKEKGYLTYEEVNNVLPSNLVAPEQIDDLMHLFGENEIEIVDSPNKNEKSAGDGAPEKGKATEDRVRRNGADLGSRRQDAERRRQPEKAGAAAWGRISGQGRRRGGQARRGGTPGDPRPVDRRPVPRCRNR